MTRLQRIDRAKRVQKHHQQLRETPIEFGRKPYRCSQEQLANRRVAIFLAVTAVACFGSALWWNQPVLALAAVVFIVGAVLIAKDA